MPTGSYSLLIDWDNDGTFTSSGENVTAKTLRVEYSRGRDVDTQLTGRSVAGSLTAILRNTTGDYNSFNSTGSLFGSLVPGRLVRLTGTDSTGTYMLWQGYVDRIVPLPSVKGLNQARIECIGPLGFINQKDVQVAPTSNIDTGTAIGLILGAAGWGTGSAYRDIDTGKTTMVRYWSDRQKTIEALREVEETEAGFVREDGSGRVIFENRHRRLSSPYTTSQATFTDDPTSTLAYQEITQEDPLPFIFTEFASTISPFTNGATGTLWILALGTGTVAIAPNGGTRVLFARYPSTATAGIGVQSWITPSATTDWHVYSDSAGTGTLLDSSIAITATSYQDSLKIIFTNNSTQVGYITTLQARGVPLIPLDKTVITSESTGTASGKRSFPRRAKFIPAIDEAQDWADWNLSIYQTATVRLTMTFIANRTTAAITQAMARDVSDRITVVATGTTNKLGINNAFFIESIKGVIDAARTHTVTYYLSNAAQFSDGWVLDVSTLGTTTRLGY